MEYEDSPDASNEVGMLMEQMETLCNNVNRLHELIESRCISEGEANLSGDFPINSGKGDGAFMAPNVESENYECLPEFSAQIVENVEPRPSQRNHFQWFQRFCSFVKWYSTREYKIFLCFLIITGITAMVVDQDLIDPYMDKYFGGTLLELPLLSIRDNWQIPLQHELRCVNPSFPIYKSKRHVFWDAMYLAFFRSPRECNPKTSYLLRLRRYLSCIVFRKPEVEWRTDKCSY